ncbi:MAG: FKBP-type peptidyl-prolyl cis-trans isomerase [Marinilabiliaceae bacterium]|nr:FKBP-type peptidyl-prolyl cis-trans isomerase [Marinilabiliaceae bacterium]
MKTVKSIIVLFLFFPFLVGCQGHDTVRKRITEEDLININKKLVSRDAGRIKDYVKENNIKMTETKTGLWYLITDEGDKEKVKKGQTISLKYDLSLLDGSLLYSSDSLGVKTFRVGQGGVESGLEEGILLLGKGSKAKFILPPHLAHGLIGDDNQVPARAILVYDIEVVDLK